MTLSGKKDGSVSLLECFDATTQPTLHRPANGVCDLRRVVKRHQVIADTTASFHDIGYRPEAKVESLEQRYSAAGNHQGLGKTEKGADSLAYNFLLTTELANLNL